MEVARTYFQTLPAVAFFCLVCAGDGAMPEVRGAVGGLAELQCNSPPPDTTVSASLHVVEWIRQGIDIPVLIKFGAYALRVHPGYEGRVSLVRTTDLQVKALVLEDQGLYQCRVLLLDKANADDLINGTWTLLSVTAPPTFTKTPPPVLEALVGHQLSLACVANGNPTPTITWLKDGGPVRGDNVEIRDGVLSLRAVSIQSGGQYTCLASSSEGNVTHVTALKIKGPPVIVIPPKSTSFNMSQNAFLQCQAVADPPNMTYEWQKGSENVHHIEALKSRVKIMVDGTLLISTLIPEDSGNYTCIPTNGMLTPPTASAILTVMHPARALPMPKNTYLPTGMEGLVTCPIMAQPPLVHVDWTKDGKPLDLALYPGWSLTSEGSVLMATVNDDAAGVYACTPYNIFGSMGSSEPTTVILQDPPSFRVAPQKLYKQEAGGTLFIPCHGNSDPATSVTWGKVGPAPRSTYSVAVNGSLLLAPVSKDHQGEWECSASNRVASVKTSTLVLVLGTSPHAATSLTVSPGVRQANVSWEAGFDGGSVQTFSVWVKQMSVKDNGKKHDWFLVPVPSSSGTRLQVTGLSPATEYQFSVLSQNKAGTGPFSEIITVRTLDPPLKRGLTPPASLSSYRAPEGVVLQWSRPTPQNPPITCFVLQSRTAQGEWVGLDEDVSANASEMIVPGLRKDCVYELRLLSRRGELLSEPSPSVNVSTLGMEIYPAPSQLLEFGPEPVLAGVMGGVGFMCLALVLLLGSACFVSHRRDRRRRKRTDEPPPAICKKPSARTSGSGSPDSVLKKSLLHSRSLFTTAGSSSTASSTASSTLRSDCSFYSQEPLSFSRDPLHHHSAPSRGPLTRAASSPISPQLELICRGPDGRFMDRHYDQASTLSVHSKRGPPSGPPSVQRSVSLRSQRGGEREPAFVLSVDLPPCGPGRAQAAAKHLSLRGQYALDEEGGYERCGDQASVLSEGSQGTFSRPGGGDSSLAYPVPKSAGQPSTTASTLVLQMEHERERGNLSRCLKLAQEREELEKELRKYTLERNAKRESWRGEPDTELEEVSDDDDAWKPQSNPFPHVPLQASRGSCVEMSSPIQWEAVPLTSTKSQVLEHDTCFGSNAQLPGPPLIKQTLHRCDTANRPSTDRFILPHLSPKHQTLERGEAQSVVVEMQRNDSRSESWRQNNRSPGSVSASATSQTNKYIVKRNLLSVSSPSPYEVHSEDLCIEMSVDEPELGVSVKSPLTKPMLHHRIASHLQEGFSLAPKGPSEDESQTHFNCQNPTAREDFERRREMCSKTPRSSDRPGKAKGSRNWDYHHRSRSLDSRRNTQSNFLTPDAWIDSLSEENCSTPFSFRPDSQFCRPQSTSSLETTRRLPSVAPPKPLPQPPPAPPPPQGVDPGCPRSSPRHHTPHHDPPTEKSLFPVDAGTPVTYKEAWRPVENVKVMKETSEGTGQREEPRLLESDSRLPWGSAWPSPEQPFSPHPEVQLVRKVEERAPEKVDVGGYRGTGESGGSYSSYASSGRGSLEPANQRLSLCLSPTLNSSPETVEESQTLAEKTVLHQMTLRKRRKASVDENYEWDTADICLPPGDQDEGLLPLVDLQRSSPSCTLPGMQHTKKALQDYSSLLQGDGHSDFCSEPQTETVLF